MSRRSLQLRLSPTTVVLLPLTMAVELGEVDLYAYLLGGAALSCLIAVQWWTPWALLLLCCWYLRYAGLRPTACAEPPAPRRLRGRLIPGLRCSAGPRRGFAPRRR